MSWRRGMQRDNFHRPYSADKHNLPLVPQAWRRHRVENATTNHLCFAFRPDPFLRTWGWAANGFRHEPKQLFMERLYCRPSRKIANQYCTTQMKWKIFLPSEHFFTFTLLFVWLLPMKGGSFCTSVLACVSICIFSKQKLSKQECQPSSQVHVDKQKK